MENEKEELEGEFKIIDDSNFLNELLGMTKKVSRRQLLEAQLESITKDVESFKESEIYEDVKKITDYIEVESKKSKSQTEFYTILTAIILKTSTEHLFEDCSK